MTSKIGFFSRLALVVTGLVGGASSARAMIDGIEASDFTLTARADFISTADGGNVLIWGFDAGSGRAQYPSATMIVPQGATVTVTLVNALPAEAGNVSIVFPGQEVTATGGVPGELTQEAPPDGLTAVTYSFIATHAGTYLYHSGSDPTLQVEMGLVGALIVRPTGFSPALPRAYEDPDTSYDREVLFLLTEMDPRIHEQVELRGVASLASTDFLTNYVPNYWFINGRTAPDTMLEPNVGWLPTQPYNCMPMMHPGEKLLMRIVDGGRDLHPFHHHGNHARVIARDGRVLDDDPAAPGLGLSYEVFTWQAAPGQSADLVFEWTGEGLGWDIYGSGPDYAHDCIDGDGDTFDDVTAEYCPDHGKPFPVDLPTAQELTFGGFYSGSPFLGLLGSLPPGEGGMNPNAGFTYMWHSHTEREMTNYDIFPGGMMTMLIIEPPFAPIMP